MKRILMALALAACGGEVRPGELGAEDGGSAGEALVGGGGHGGEGPVRAGAVELGSGGNGGAPAACTPKTLCRAKEGPCDTPELCSDDGTCPDDEVLPYGTVAGSISEHPCGWFACDGESVGCPESCEDDDGCRPWPGSPQKGYCDGGACVGPDGDQ